MSAQDELSAYLALPQVPVKTADGKFLDTLGWWRANKDSFPRIAHMARQYLGVPASSATVERLFSGIGLTFSDLRKSVHESTTVDLAWTKFNVSD